MSHYKPKHPIIWLSHYRVTMKMRCYVDHLPIAQGRMHSMLVSIVMLVLQLDDFMENPTKSMTSGYPQDFRKPQYGKIWWIMVNRSDLQTLGEWKAWAEMEPKWGVRSKTEVKIAAVCQRSWGTTPSQMRQPPKFEHVPGPTADPWVPFRLTAIVRFDDEGLLFHICKPQIFGAVMVCGSRRAVAEFQSPSLKWLQVPWWKTQH